MSPNNFSMLLAENKQHEFSVLDAQRATEISSPVYITSISSSIPVHTFFGTTLTTEFDDSLTTQLFQLSNTTRLVNLLSEKDSFESEYKMSSADFFSAWKSGAKFDNRRFDRWSEICQKLNYVGLI